LLKLISNFIKKLRSSKSKKEIDEEGIGEIEEAARKAAKELEEFEDQEIFGKYLPQLHEKSKRINRRVRAIIRLIRLKLKGVRYMSGAAAELEQLEEERVRVLGELTEEVPIEEVAGGPAPTAFFNDLFTAIRDENWRDLDGLLSSGVNQGFLYQSQARSIKFLQQYIETGQFDYAINQYLSLPEIRQYFEPNLLYAIDELLRIVEEKRKDDITQLYNRSNYNKLRAMYGPQSFGVENIREFFLNYPRVNPMFNIMEGRSYWFIKITENTGYVIPSSITFTSLQIRNDGAETLFNIENYESGYRYRHIDVIEPALVQKRGKEWTVINKGHLRLGIKEREA